VITGWGCFSNAYVHALYVRLDFLSFYDPSISHRWIQHCILLVEREVHLLYYIIFLFYLFIGHPSLSLSSSFVP